VVIRIAKQESLEIAAAKDNRRQEGMKENIRKHLLSLGLLRWKGERDHGIIIPLPLAIQEPSQPLYLRGEIHHDDLHLDVKVELENIRARFEGLCPCGDEHVPLKAELLKRVDQLAEFCAPSQHPKLQEFRAQDTVAVKVQEIH